MARFAQDIFRIMNGACYYCNVMIVTVAATGGWILILSPCYTPPSIDDDSSVPCVCTSTLRASTRAFRLSIRFKLSIGRMLQPLLASASVAKMFSPEKTFRLGIRTSLYRLGLQVLYALIFPHPFHSSPWFPRVTYTNILQFSTPHQYVSYFLHVALCCVSTWAGTVLFLTRFAPAMSQTVWKPSCVTCNS